MLLQLLTKEDVSRCLDLCPRMEDGNKTQPLKSVKKNSESVKVERLKELNSLVERTAKRRNERYKALIEEVLAEGINPKDQQQLMGRTRTNRLTFFPKQGAQGSVYKPGELVKLRIKEVRSFSLSGVPIDE